MLHEEVAKYRELSGDTNPDTPISRIGGYLDGYEKALEQEPCDVFDKYGNYKYPSDVELTEPNTATSMPCEDAISRQIISDYVESHIQEINTGYGDLNEHTNRILRMIMEYIDKLPSVNPQPKTDSWSIKDVANTFKKHGLIREQEPCKDAISRKDTIDWLKRVTKTDGITFETGFKQIIHDIEQMPSVEPVNPQPKVGHWVDTNSKSFEFHRVYKCSECGTTEIEYPESIYRHLRYCPNCGAKMVEPQK